MVQDISNRIWTGDFEIIYLKSGGYVEIFNHITFMSKGIIDIKSISEQWNTEDYTPPEMLISYIANNKNYEIWVERTGDYIDSNIFSFINLQLNLIHYKFYAGHDKYDSQILLINDFEKTSLANDIEIYEYKPLSLIIFNIHKHLSLKNNYAYTLLLILIKLIDISEIELITQQSRDRIKEIILMIDWDIISKENIDIGLLYTIS